MALLTLAACVGALPAKTAWEPITSAELAGTACTWYPGADAEALLMRVVLVGNGNWSFHGEYYKRIKVYSPKGVEDMGVFSIEHADGQRVWDHAARVTKPDGTNQVYGKENFHETVEAKLGTSKSMRLKLAVPDLAAGDIVEIKWKIDMTSFGGSYYWWYAQLDVPVRLYTFSTRDLGYPYSANWFNIQAEGKRRKSDDGMDLVMTNLAPFKSEPAMPPERDVRGWFMIYFSYVFRNEQKDGDILKDISEYISREFRDRTKPDATVKARAQELAAGAGTDDEKLRRFYEFCQQRVENFDYLDSVALQAAKKKLGDDQDQSPKKTLARGSGNSSHINDLFASLARAAGYEVTEGRSASRNSTLGVRGATGWLFLQDQMIMVKLGGNWRCFAPGDYRVPYGILDQSDIAVPALACLKDKPEWLVTSAPVAADSVIDRNGRFAIDADGNLEGEVEMTMTGYPAIARKRNAHGRQQEEIDADFRTGITEWMPTAEISDLTWENLTSGEMPLKIRYKVRVPGYADVVGSRLVVPLDYFTHNRPAEFAAEVRKFPIAFAYPYLERDNVRLIAPEGFKADAPSAPENVTGNGGIGCAYRVAYRPSARQIDYTRDLTVGQAGQIMFVVDSYPALKTRFASIKRSDAHTIVFAPAPAAGAQ